MKLYLLPAIALSIFFAAPAFAEGDADKGKRIYKKCASCHAIQQGKNKLGPSLFGIIDRPAASIKGYKYSKAMKESGLIWDEKTLKGYLKKPRKFLPGTKMAFSGLKKDKQLADIVAYLKTLK